MSINKILIITSEYPPGPGGIGNHAWNLNKHLKANGIETKVITEIRNYEKKDRYTDVVFLKRGFLPFYFTFFYNATLIISKWKPDLIYLSGSKSIITGYIISNLFSVPFVVVYHGHEWHMSNKTWRPLIKKTLQNAVRIITVSNFSKNKIQTFLSNKNVEVIPNGIQFNNSMLSFESQSNGLNLLTVGSITQRKGQLNVIDAIPVLLKKHPELKYHLVGIPVEKDKVFIRSNKLQVMDHIVLHGYISDDELENIYQSTDLFLMLSNNLPNGDVEGFGIAILEANARGIPAIGSKGTGIEEAIIPGVNGELVDPRNPEEISKKTELILKDYQQYRSNSIEHAKKLDWSLVIKKYLNFNHF